LGCATAEPTLQILTFGQRSSQSRKHGAADYLLLQPQMIVKQLVPSNMPAFTPGMARFIRNLASISETPLLSLRFGRFDEDHCPF